MNIKKLITNAHRIFCKLADKMQSPFLLAVRLYWGVQFLQTGIGKLQHLDRVTDFFTSLGLPMPHLTAIFVGSLETVGGGLLVLGLASRITALLLAVNMLVAYITADRDSLFAIFSEPDKFYAATPYTFLFASVLVLIFGAGLFSADGLLGRYFARKLVSE